jgi:hypothetical protein
MFSGLISCRDFYTSYSDILLCIVWSKIWREFMFMEAANIEQNDDDSEAIFEINCK